MGSGVFVGFQWSDLAYMGEAALRTLSISLIAIVAGTALGVVFGWMLYAGRWLAAPLALVLDAFRSVPLIIQLILFFNFWRRSSGCGSTRSRQARRC
jgi:His/Glu/Gln/Arg/opine family amino acid ABC transporter permease subunit